MATLDITGGLDLIDNGQLVGRLSCRTTAQGNKQLVVEGTDSVPVITIGGDRSPSDVQISRMPMERPFVGFQLGYLEDANGNITGDGTHGDALIRGTLVVAPPEASTDGQNLQLTVDPAGCIVMSRFLADPGNSCNLRFYQKFGGQSNPPVEVGRMGTNGMARLYLGPSGNWDQLSFNFGNDFTSLVQKHQNPAQLSLLSFDNSGSGKYKNGKTGTVTTFGP